MIIISALSFVLILCMCSCNHIGNSVELSSYQSSDLHQSYDFPSDAVWLRCDSANGFGSVDVPLGTVMLSENLIKALEEYDETTLLNVGICFSSMIPAEYLYHTDSVAKYDYYEKILDSLEYSGSKIVRGLVCKEFFFFYTSMTKDELLNLKCGENEAFYVAGIDLQK